MIDDWREALNMFENGIIGMKIVNISFKINI
jgi:hypothetical protein